MRVVGAGGQFVRDDEDRGGQFRRGDRLQRPLGDVELLAFEEHAADEGVGHVGPLLVLPPDAQDERIRRKRDRPPACPVGALERELALPVLRAGVLDEDVRRDEHPTLTHVGLAGSVDRLRVRQRLAGGCIADEVAVADEERLRSPAAQQRALAILPVEHLGHRLDRQLGGCEGDDGFREHRLLDRHPCDEALLHRCREDDGVGVLVGDDRNRERHAGAGVAHEPPTELDLTDDPIPSPALRLGRIAVVFQFFQVGRAGGVDAFAGGGEYPRGDLPRCGLSAGPMPRRGCYFTSRRG